MYLVGISCKYLSQSNMDGLGGTFPTFKDVVHLVEIVLA